MTSAICFFHRNLNRPLVCSSSVAGQGCRSWSSVAPQRGNTSQTAAIARTRAIKRLLAEWDFSMENREPCVRTMWWGGSGLNRLHLSRYPLLSDLSRRLSAALAPLYDQILSGRELKDKQIASTIVYCGVACRQLLINVEDVWMLKVL